jgi:hypothetical protein
LSLADKAVDALQFGPVGKERGDQTLTRSCRPA